MIVAVAVLVVTAPICAVAALVVKVSSRGPLFAREVRIGRGGRRFEMLAFRTTHVDADGVVRSGRVDRVFQALSIDELPRWWNVLRGDLGIVGPEPPHPGDVGGPGSDLVDLRPGMTGLWRASRR